MKSHRYFVLTPVLILLLALTGSLIARAQDVVTVTWWTEEGDFLQNIQDKLVKGFNDSHPNIKLELVGQTNINDVLRTAFQAGEAPDILQTPGASFIAEYLASGQILPLDSYAEKNGWKDKLLPWAYESGILENKLYSLPLTFESMVLFYNKTLFEKQGWMVPTNATDFWKLTQTISDAGIIPFAYSNSEWKPSNEHLIGVYLNNVAGSENVYKALTGEKKWTDPEFAEAIQLLSDQMTTKGWYSGSLDNYYAYTNADVMGDLTTEKAAMMISGTWNFASIGTYFTPEIADQWDWAPIPMFKEGVGDYSYLLATGSTVSVNAKSKNIDAAVEVLNYLLSDPKKMLENAAGAGFGEFMLPMHFTEADFPEGSDPRIVRYFADFAKVTGEGRYGYTTWTFWPAKPNVQLWTDIESVWAGDETVADYLAAQQAEWDTARADGKTLPIPKR